MCWIRIAGVGYCFNSGGCAVKGGGWVIILIVVDTRNRGGLLS